MFILDSLLIGGIKFALEKVLAVAEQELDNPEDLHQQLLEAQMDSKRVASTRGRSPKSRLTFSPACAK